VQTLDDYLDRLASSDAVPGGGSAAALTGAIASALVAMVGRIVAAPVEGLVERADDLRAKLGEARVRDEQAFAAVIAAQGLAKTTDLEKAARAEALERALTGAAQAPLEAAKLCVDVLRLAGRLAREPRGALMSDVGCAAELAHAAVLGCAYNVRINHRYMHDEPTIRSQAATMVRYEGEATRILTRVRGAAAKG